MERYLAAGATVIGVDIVKGDIEGIDNVECDVGSVEKIQELEEYLKDKCVSFCASAKGVAAFVRRNSLIWGTRTTSS